MNKKCRICGYDVPLSAYVTQNKKRSSMCEYCREDKTNNKGIFLFGDPTKAHDKGGRSYMVLGE